MSIDNRILELTDKRFIRLIEELQYHPKLHFILNKYGENDKELILAEVCYFLNILVDGTYKQEDMYKMCEICTNRLEKIRPTRTDSSIIIMP